MCFIACMKHTLICLLLGVGVGVADAAPPPCASAEHRQFDFWIGDWRVHTPDGKFAGINRITQEYGGCVIHEHYVTGKGYSGESLNVYDAARQVWHQTWVDSEGLLLTLEGRWDGKGMLLEGLAPTQSGGMARQRIRWTPHDDGSVRQLWEAADDKGNWSVVFDGRYTRK
jgi:hypothetical protein